MINSEQMRKVNSQRATISTAQSQRFYCSKKLSSPTKDYLKSSRSQVSMSIMQDSKSRVNTLFDKIKTQNKQQHTIESSAFFRVEGEILELYNQYEKNYKGIKSLDRIKTVEENKSVEYKKQNDQLIKTFDGLKQSDLDLKSINQIQIERYQFYYFRLRVLDKPTPIHLHLLLPEQISFLLFKLLLSLKIEFPTKFNADQIIQSNYAKMYSNNIQNAYFKEEFLYLTFYSHVDFILKISVNFGLHQDNKSIKKKESLSPKVNMIWRDICKKNSTPDKKGINQFKSHSKFNLPNSVDKIEFDDHSRLDTENSDRKKFTKINCVQSKLSTLLHQIGKEYKDLSKEERIKKIEEEQMLKRKEMEQDSNLKSKFLQKVLEQRQKSIEQVSRMRQYKIDQAQSNKKKFFIEKQRSIKDKMIVQEQISQFREIERSFTMKKAYAYKISKNWGSLIRYTIFIDILYNFIMDQKRKSKIQARGKLLVWTIKTKALMEAKEYGGSTKERTITKCMISVTLIAKTLKKRIKANSQNILSKFFVQMKLALTILYQHDRTIKKIIKIQRNFRSSKQKKTTFRDKFMKLIRENINQTIDDLQRQTGKKKFYDQNDKPVQQLDITCINSLIDEYQKYKKQLWFEYINGTFFEKDFHKKMKDFAINIKEPQLYELPKRKELIQIIEKYGKIKKLL